MRRVEGGERKARLRGCAHNRLVRRKTARTHDDAITPDRYRERKIADRNRSSYGSRGDVDYRNRIRKVVNDVRTAPVGGKCDSGWKRAPSGRCRQRNVVRFGNETTARVEIEDAHRAARDVGSEDDRTLRIGGIARDRNPGEKRRRRFAVN